jgi:tRNA-specific 2-thiouridylase
MIAVAMSGGVDSSAAAALLRDQGESIVGLSMQLWNQRRTIGNENEAESGDAEVARTGRCCSLDDIWDARRVATHLGIPFYVLNLEGQFEQTVVAPFVDSYLRGETPSPCILCNNFVKFHHLVDRAAAIGADRVATGHYARVRFDETLGRWLLLRGKDRNKDQSYFLFGLTQNQLSKTVFPLGELTKPQVREIARHAGLPTYDKAESQEICFVSGEVLCGLCRKVCGLGGCFAWPHCRFPWRSSRPALRNSQLHHWTAEGIGCSRPPAVRRENRAGIPSRRRGRE